MYKSIKQSNTIKVAQQSHNCTKHVIRISIINTRQDYQTSHKMI
jgi:hypothetical protein